MENLFLRAYNVDSISFHFHFFRKMWELCGNFFHIPYLKSGRNFVHICVSSQNQSALILKHYETHYDCCFSDGRGCALCSWPGFSKDC